ncbi:DUF3732 domain-containing protein [Nocardioides plantarum]|nr:DUF3732 domain-containing protein [Nocardioides plantarum]
MQINQIILYSNSGEMRVLTLLPGRMNIITGASLKGKSSLIGILRYLLGSGSPHAPALIRGAVSWYGLVASVGEESFFIGRPRVGGSQTTNQAMWLPGATDAPAYVDLTTNATAEEVRNHLGGLLGIGANENVPDPGHTRAPLAATFVHSLYYCFLEQGEIANPYSLFHHQTLDFQAQAIRDTLPYFVGAQGRDEMALRDRLRGLRRDRRRIELQLGQLDAFQLQETAVARTLMGQARDFGIIDVGELVAEESAIDSLRSALTSATAGFGMETPASVPQDEYERLIDDSRMLRESMREQSAQLRRLNRFAEDSAGYEVEVSEQRSRLASARLVPEPKTEGHCPLCGQGVAGLEGVMSSNLAMATGDADHRLRSAARDQRQIAVSISELQASIERDRVGYEATQAALREIDRLRAQETERARSLEMRSFVVGRISQFLETHDEATDVDRQLLTSRITDLRRQIEQLEERIDGDAVRSRTQSLMNLVSRRMAEYAQFLGLEHSTTGVRIDPQRLTVVADLPSGPAYMSEKEIGGGMNWVGYHLATYLAMQAYFIEHARPVPSFIVFDQPSQVFFPEEDSASEGDAVDFDDLEVGDKERTRRLFMLINDAVTAASGNLQVLVLDHADFLSEPWFQDAVLEKWRGSAALIPAGWLDEQPEVEG